MTGKQLRNSILQWAIQGKLVPQDPNDEPASVLLERIREEKAHLVKEKKIKRDKNESIIYRGDDNSYYEKNLVTGEVICIDDEIPFNLPNGWVWCRLNNLSEIVRGGSPRPAGSPEYYDGKIPFLKVADLTKDNCMYVTSHTATIKEAGLKKTREVSANTLLLTNSGATLGVPKICTFNTTFNDGIAAFLYLSEELKPFVYWFLCAMTDTFRNINQGTAQPNLNTEIIKRTLFAMPPLNEQKRIIERIEEISPIIDKYSHAQQNLSALNDTLFENLKKSILNEAIKGRLVQQDDNGESASVLLQRIKNEKLELTRKGVLKKKDVIDSVIYRGDDNKYYENLNGEVTEITDQIPFDIPTSWQWVRLRALCNIATGASFKKEEASVEGANKVRILRGGNILPFRLQLKDDDIFINRELVNENILLRQNDLVTPAVTSLENICKMARIEQDYVDMTMGGFVFIIRGYFNDKTLARYLQCVFGSPTTIEFVRSITNKSGQAFYNIGKERLSNTLIPLPPFDEMDRITLKIDELLQLCDQR